MPAIATRPATASDLAELTALFVDTFNAPPWNDGWTKDAALERLSTMVHVPHFRGAIAHDATGAVGMLLGHVERWVAAYHFNLVEMCVTPERQRTGIGTKLLEFMRDKLAQEGIGKVYLMTAPGAEAEAFYRKHGFERSKGRVVLVSSGPWTRSMT